MHLTVLKSSVMYAFLSILYFTVRHVLPQSVQYTQEDMIKLERGAITEAGGMPEATHGDA